MSLLMMQQEVGFLNPNTFIGGLGIVFPTRESLISSKWMIGVAAEDIRNYKVDDSNISFNVKKNYEINLGFSSNEITYFVDKDGKCNNIGQRSFVSTSLQFVYFPKVVEHRSSGGYSAFAGMSSYYKYFSMPSLKNDQEYYVPLNSFLNSNTNFQTLNLKGLTNLTLQVEVARRAFYNLTNLNRLDISGVTRILGRMSGSTLVYNFFQNLKSGCIVICNTALMSFEGIEPHPFVTQLIENGAIVRFKLNEIAPNPVTDLFVTEITENGCTINFTTPAISENDIDFYEVWADDGDHVWRNLIHRDEITTSGSVVTSFESGKNYKLTLITKDVFFNSSQPSNEVSFTTLIKTTV